MIKASVKVSCRINGNATVKTAHDGSQFVSIPCIATIRDRRGETLEQTISVTCDPTLAMPQFITPGSRIEYEGDMSFRRRADNLYLNLRATAVNLAPQSVVDNIEGTIVVQGRTGEKIIEKTDKKDRPMIIFSTYSSEKVEDTFEHVWVSCTAFKTARPEWLRHKEKVEVSGNLELGVFKGKLTLNCTCRDLKHPTEQQ